MTDTAAPNSPAVRTATPENLHSSAARRRMVPNDVLRLRMKPSCGHKTLVDCPLVERDWEEVHRAWTAFRAVCVSVAERAHERTLPDA